MHEDFTGREVEAAVAQLRKREKRAERKCEKQKAKQRAARERRAAYAAAVAGLGTDAVVYRKPSPDPEVEGWVAFWQRELVEAEAALADATADAREARAMLHVWENQRPADVPLAIFRLLLASPGSFAFGGFTSPDGETVVRMQS